MPLIAPGKLHGTDLDVIGQRVGPGPIDPRAAARVGQAKLSQARARPGGLPGDPQIIVLVAHDTNSQTKILDIAANCHRQEVGHSSRILQNSDVNFSCG